MIHESDQRIQDAIRHREIEISLIERLHGLVADGTDEPSVLSNYEVQDLRLRKAILAELVAAGC